MSKLTDKQNVFIQEYLLDLNATQAAIRAGYSVKAASEIGYENLRKPQIQNKLEDLINERANRLEIDSDWVVKELRGLYELCRVHREYSTALKALE